jgi:hypothetical protein
MRSVLPVLTSTCVARRRRRGHVLVDVRGALSSPDSPAPARLATNTSMTNRLDVSPSGTINRKLPP